MSALPASHLQQFAAGRLRVPGELADQLLPLHGQEVSHKNVRAGSPSNKIVRLIVRWRRLLWLGQCWVVGDLAEAFAQIADQPFELGDFGGPDEDRPVRWTLCFAARGKTDYNRCMEQLDRITHVPGLM